MILPRYYLDSLLLPNSTPGSWFDVDHKTLIAKTLELPWRNNAIGKTWETASCISAGIVLVRKEPPRYTRPYGHFRIVHVPGRHYEPSVKGSSVLVHRANKVEQLLGCIAPGSRHTDLDKDGGVDIVESTLKLEWMYQNLPELFELQIDRRRV